MAGHTRNAVASSQKQGRTPTPTRPGAPLTPSGATANATKSISPEPDDTNVESLLTNLSKENKTLVKIMKVIITQQLKTEIESLKEEMNRKDTEVEQLKSEVKDLKNKVITLETQIDDVEQYERRDTIILSGPTVPAETQTENTVSLAVGTIKDHLKINVEASDISVAHRLGPKQNQTRPIIVKLVNRSLKYDMVGACIKLKPGLYVNESLTPKRLSVMKKILAIRKQHQQKFQQCYTKDGKIMIKLKNSTVKHTIVDDKTLLNFLEKYPVMKNTYEELLSSA